MSSLQQSTLNFNKSLSYDFNGGSLSSDSGLLMIRSFTEKLALRPLLEEAFNKDAKRKHSTSSIIEQLIYTTVAGYRSDDDSDSLRYDPVFTAVLDKDSLASQPTISRCMNSLDQEAVSSLNRILQTLFEKGNPVKKTKNIVLDIDSTLFQTFGNQSGSFFNYHYSSKGYHPLMLFNGLNGDLIKAQLRDGNVYTSNDVKSFLEPVLEWLKEKYPDAKILLRADSGFATPEIYDLCDEHDIEFVIRLKANATLRKLSNDAVDQFTKKFGSDYSKTCIAYDEFTYQAKSWKKPQRVVVRVERAAGELLARATFIVTTLKAAPKTIVKAYNKRGNMENFIKEAKIDFSMDTVSHSSFTANAVKTMVKAIAYSVVNIMKRAVLPHDRITSRLLSIRNDLIKIASRAVTSARKTVFRLCGSSPYKDLFDKVMRRIGLIHFN